MSFQIRKIRQEPERSKHVVKAMKMAQRYLKPGFIVLGALWRRNEQHKKDEQRVALLKRIMVILLGILATGILFIIMLRVLIGLQIISLSGAFGMVGGTLPKDDNGFTNILLLGQGDDNHDGQELTDTVMIASLDPGKTKSAVLLSLPRDLYFLKTEKMSVGRVNSLYRDAKLGFTRSGMSEDEASKTAMSELAKEIGAVVDLDIHHVIKLNFSGFTQAIDAIGGIDVNVEQAIVDTEYPGPNYSYVTFTMPAGLQHMDGETALKYARSRHSTSDFSRSHRQQQIIAAAAQKMKESGWIANIGRMTEIMGIISSNMESTMTTREIIALGAMGKALDSSKVFSMQLSDENGLYGRMIGRGGFLYAPPREEFDGAAVLLPVSIPPFPVRWKQVHTLGTLIFTHRDVVLNKTKMAVLNAGAKEGVGRLTGGELYRYGFDVTSIENYDESKTPPVSTSFIGVLKTDDAVKTKATQASAVFLAKLLNLKIVEFSPGDAPATREPSELFLVLREDFSYTPLQDLSDRL